MAIVISLKQVHGGKEVRLEITQPLNGHGILVDKRTM
jgi:hypothetical protein